MFTEEIYKVRPNIPSRRQQIQMQPNAEQGRCFGPHPSIPKSCGSRIIDKGTVTATFPSSVIFGYGAQVSVGVDVVQENQTTIFWKIAEVGSSFCGNGSNHTGFSKVKVSGNDSNGDGVDFQPLIVLSVNNMAKGTVVYPESFIYGKLKQRLKAIQHEEKYGN